MIYDINSKIINEKTLPPALSLGYEVGDGLDGVVALSPVYFDSSHKINAYILSALAVHRSHRKKGIASKLVERSKADLISAGVDMMFVYGDPNYYGKFGFEIELAKQFIPPYPLKFEFGCKQLC